MERNEIINSVSPRHQCQEQEQEEVDISQSQIYSKTSEDLISREQMARPEGSVVKQMERTNAQLQERDPSIRHKFKWRTG